MTALGLATLPDRCDLGFHITQHPHYCACRDLTEWVIFRTAVREVTRPDGTVHVNDIRPRIRGRIEPKRVGSLYRRAKAEGLLVDTGRKEPSSDVAGRNRDKDARIYRIGARA